MKKLWICILIAIMTLTGCGSNPAENPQEPEIPAKVTVQWGGDVSDGLEMDEIALDTSEDQTQVVFTAEGHVTDFKLLALNFEDIDQDGNALFSVEVLHQQDQLLPERPLAVGMTFFGTIPAYGISYENEKGETKDFAVQMSGADGSVLLTEHIFCTKSDAVLEVPLRTYEAASESGEYIESVIEIPQIIGDESPAAQKINSDLKEWFEELNSRYVGDTETWCEVLAWPAETSRYLNAVMTACEYPIYGTYGTVQSRVYDKLLQREVTLEEALKMAGASEASLLADFAAWRKDLGDEMETTGIDSLAFRMMEDGQPQFMAGVTCEDVASGDRWTTFHTWTGGEILWYENTPFAAADVKLNLEDGFLSCHRYFTEFYFDESLTAETALETLMKIAEVQAYLDEGMSIREMGCFEIINYELCVLFSLSDGTAENGETEHVYGASAQSVYKQSVSGDWEPVAFG